MAREEYAGPETGPRKPFPLRLHGRIVKGFGRGSKELGIPTANIPIAGLEVGGHSDIESGVYFGWAGLHINSTNPNMNNDDTVYPMVMSIGWNPYYKNEVRSVEVHIISKFAEDFYNAMMTLSILGFIRSEKDYDGLEALIADINTDIDVAKRSLERPAYASLSKDSYLLDFSWEHSSSAI